MVSWTYTECVFARRMPDALLLRACSGSRAAASTYSPTYRKDVRRGYGSHGPARGSRCVYITGSFERARDSVARSNVHEPPCASSIRLPAKLGSGSLWIYALQDCDLCNQRNYSSHVCLNTMVPSTIRDAREANFTEITGGEGPTSCVSPALCPPRVKAA